MKIDKKITGIFLFLCIAINLCGQDTIRKLYRPWINEKVYTRMASVIKHKSPIIKLVDLSGNVRFIGQVWSDCGSYNGTTSEYFKSGKIKALKMYAPAVTNGCPLKTGTWIFYNKNGSVKKEVVYKLGERQK